MGLLVQSSSVETVSGRVRFTPAPPDPWWMRLAEGVMWVAPAVLLVSSIALGDLDTLTIIIGVFWALAIVSALAGRMARREMPPVPREPIDIPEPLLDEARAYARKDQDLEALRALRAGLGVGLIDARKILDVAVGR